MNHARDVRIQKYRGHTIRESEEFGWSDSQQQMVNNGFRVEIDGPNYSANYQTYCGVGHDTFTAIDRAIAKARGT